MMLLNKKQVLYILDEPTDGLHLHDVQLLMTLFQSMVDEGNTLVIVDHHLDMIRDADYVIELGPAGGFLGGHLLFQGRPKAILESKSSITKDYF